MATGRYWLSRIDAFEWLARRKKQSIHAVVTDPPFGIIEYTPKELRKRANGTGIWRLPQAFDGAERMSMPRFTVLRKADHERIAEFHRELAKKLYKVLVPGGHVIMSSQPLLAHLTINAFIESGFELRGQLARSVRTFRGGDRPKGAHKKFSEVSVSPRSCWEPWLIFRKPCEGLVRDNLKKWQAGALRRPSRDKPFSDLITSGPARGLERRITSHPSLKPQAFLRQIVNASLPLGRGIVLDPFMGSGSTIAAARALGIRSIGLEINRKYFDLATRAIPKLAALTNGSNGQEKRRVGKRGFRATAKKR